MYDDDDNSLMFKVDDKSEETDINNVFFFDKNTLIIQPGQRNRVIFGEI
jgi:hypothetical protein